MYNYFSIPTGEFFASMLIPTLVAFTLVIGCCLCVKKEAWRLDSKAYDDRLDVPRTVSAGRFNRRGSFVESNRAKAIDKATTIGVQCVG